MVTMNAKQKLLLKLHEHFPLLSKGTGIIMLNQKLGRSVLSTTTQIRYLLEQGLISEPHPDWVCVLTDLGKQEVKKFTFTAIAAELFGDEVPKGYLFFIDAEEDRTKPEQFDKKNIQSIEKAIQYYSSRPDSDYFQLQFRAFKELLNPISQIVTNIQKIKTLSTRRPLLAREKFELATLEKLQKTDNLEQLERLQNEVENEATDAELKTQLLIIIEEKKGFY
jgi:hypothetical protein